MKHYARIINEETKTCEVGIGTDVEFYQSVGMVEMDVEEGYDGNWYVAGYAPIKPIPTIEEQNAEISKRREFLYEKEIDGLHAKKQRRTIIGKWTDEDEANYIEEVKRLSAKIEEENPYVV